MSAGERRERLFGQLEELYAALPDSAEENLCGTCRECCTTKGLNIHSITNLELEYIGERIGTSKLDDFRRFATRKSDLEVCPYFDEETWGCGIYQVRPFSCRTFGHYRSRDTRLPEVCVFQGQEKIFDRPQYYDEVPQARALRALVRRFWPYQSGPDLAPEVVGESFVETNLQAGDALDQALVLQSQGKPEEALALLIESDIEDSPYSLYCVGLMLESQQRHEEACLAFSQGLKEAPECVPLHFRLGCNLLSSGQLDQAEETLRTVLQLDEEHVPCLALLGGLMYTLGRLEEASSLLKRAENLDPTNEHVLRMLQAIPNAT